MLVSNQLQLLVFNLASVFTAQPARLADPSFAVLHQKRQTPPYHHYDMQNADVKGDISGLVFPSSDDLDKPFSVTLDGCSKEDSLPGGQNGRGTCVIGLGEQLSGQIVAKAVKTIPQPLMPTCSIGVPAVDCNGSDRSYSMSDYKPCPGDFSFNSTFPVQKGEVLLINYTVTGEQRFYDFWSNTDSAQGHCSWWEWEMIWQGNGNDGFDSFLWMDIDFQFTKTTTTTTKSSTTTTTAAAPKSSFHWLWIVMSLLVGMDVVA